MRYQLEQIEAENDSLQRSLDSTRVEVLEEELGNLEEDMVKLNQVVMEDKIRHVGLMIKQSMATEHAILSDLQVDFFLRATILLKLSFAKIHL